MTDVTCIDKIREQQTVTHKCAPGGFVEQSVTVVMERLSWIQKHTMILSNLVECLSPSLQPTITVPARGQVFNLTETAFGNFIVGGYVGSLRFLADSPIAVIGFDYWLNLGNLTSTREPFDEAMPTSGATLPHLPSGFQGYQTRIQILRTSDTQATKGVIRFFSETGDPVDPQTLLQ